MNLKLIPEKSVFFRATSLDLRILIIHDLGTCKHEKHLLHDTPYTRISASSRLFLFCSANERRTWLWKMGMDWENRADRRWWFFALRKDEERSLPPGWSRGTSSISIRKNRTQEDPTRGPEDEDDNGDR